MSCYPAEKIMLFWAVTESCVNNMSDVSYQGTNRQSHGWFMNKRPLVHRMNVRSGCNVRRVQTKVHTLRCRVVRFFLSFRQWGLRRRFQHKIVIFSHFTKLPHFVKTVTHTTWDENDVSCKTQTNKHFHSIPSK